jgi:transcriptional regulator with XRE-family HTH domain
MGRSNGLAPVNGKALREARIGKFMSQADVLRACVARGVVLDQGNLSRIERGTVRWPAPSIIPVLAEVVGLTTDELLAPAPEGASATEDAA